MSQYLDDSPSNRDLFMLLRDVLPLDSAKQSCAEAMLEEISDQLEFDRIVDLGCGKGLLLRWAREKFPNIRYLGLDVSPYKEFKTFANDPSVSFRVYDGRRIPLDSGSVPLIFCKQVLEHVVNPHEFLPEVARVLGSNSLFVGSVSQFEPYHSHSVLNYTCYGIKRLFNDNGLKLLKLRPSIDMYALQNWYVLPNHKNRWVMSWTDQSPFDCASPFNYEIDMLSKRYGWTIQETNLEKLKYAGQISFVATRSKKE